MESIAMSKLALLGVIAAATLAGIEPGSASILGDPPDRGAWCLRYDIGGGAVQENCRFESFEACNRERSLWGSTASCTQNPAFRGYWDEDRPRTRKKPYHRR
jgi:hypothetical protein